MQAPEETIKKLKAMRDDISHRIEAIEADVHHKKEPVEKDFAEQVTQRENEDVLNALDDESIQTLNQVNAALLRIERGEYGICEKCGEQIDPKRLEALPFATTCINCAE
ncbi:MAG TPA: TraR/DksA family transcriptional regulator [Gammaproteobacteria bacterium]|nr:TraR/DksA family transcriptional regulator [Gammaproteobacteria bacterium]